MARSKKKKRLGVCAICGADGEVNREHVPPRNLFLEPRPTNTITVDLCLSCNHGYHLDDEYFRVYVAAGAKPGTPLMELWKKKVVDSSFARSGGLKGRLKDEREHVQEFARQNPLPLFGGGNLPPAFLPRVQGFDASRINRVVEKIVRCLHLRHVGKVLTGNLHVNVAPLSTRQWQEVLDERSGEVGHHNEFVYRFNISESGAEIWRLIFYEHQAFTVHVRPAT